MAVTAWLPRACRVRAHTADGRTSLRVRGAPAELGVLVAPLLLGACAPALDWREVRPPDSGVVALFPCKPSTLARSVELAGQTVRLSLTACNAGGQTWAVAAADVGDPARVRASLEALRASAVRNLGAAADGDPLPLAVPGATPNPASGRALIVGRMPDGRPVHEQLALFARGTVVVQATALGAQLPAEAAETFFGGLRAQ